MKKASKHRRFPEWECFLPKKRFSKVIPGGDTIVGTYGKSQMGKRLYWSFNQNRY